METTEDSALMTRVRDGEVQKLAVLFERHHRALFQFFARLGGSRELAEDLVQDVFFRMLKYRHTYHAGNQFTSWMYQIARNAFMDMARKRRLEMPMPEEEEDRDRCLASSEPNADERIRQDQENRLLRQALAALPEDKREVLILSRYQQLKYEQIAAILGCDTGTVKVRVYRAVKELGRNFIRLAEGGKPGLRRQKTGFEGGRAL